MRVTENTNFESIRGNIRKSREKMEGLQNQAASMKKLNAPSDDPVAAAKVLQVRTDQASYDQFQVNAQTAQAYLSHSEYALGELAEIILRAKEIALSQAGQNNSNDITRLASAEELARLQEQAVATANVRIGERYLFGGYKTQVAPIDPQGAYHGDSGQMMTEISKGVFLAMNVPGAEVFTAVDGQGANLFEEIQNFRVALLKGDLDGVRNALDRFDSNYQKLNSVRAQVGSRMRSLQNVMQAGERHRQLNAQVSSVLEDADVVQVVSDLAKEESIFRSALASSQKLIQPTLMEFLK